MKTHKSLRIGVKTISLFLSISLIIQIIGFAAYAAQDINNNEFLEASDTNQFVAPSIIKEITKNRTEKTKDFLLEDGSYCSVYTAEPMHELVNDEWKEIETPEVSLSEVPDFDRSLMQPLDRGEMTEVSGSGISITTSGDVFDMTWDDEIFYIYQEEEGELRVHINDLAPYIAKNRVIDHAILSFERDEFVDPMSIDVDIYEADLNGTIDNGKLLNCITVTDNDEYIVDITNTVGKWDIENSIGYADTAVSSNYDDNSGIVLHVVCGETDNLTIKNIKIEIYYTELDYKDANYTYRTFDFENAGILNVNDYTNALYLEHPLFELDSDILPITVSRLHLNPTPNASGTAGCGFIYNLESNLEVDINDGIAYWRTIEGHQKTFAVGNNPVIENGYQKWEEVNNRDYSDNYSAYLLVPNEEYDELNPFDYSDAYILIGNTEYHFNSVGQLTIVQKSNANNIAAQVIISYDSNERITSITTENGTSYGFTYQPVAALRAGALKSVKVVGESTNIISFNTSLYTHSYGNQQTETLVKNRATLPDSSTATWYFNLDGYLRIVEDSNQNSWLLDYSKYSKKTPTEFKVCAIKETLFNPGNEDPTEINYGFSMPFIKQRLVSEIKEFSDNSTETASEILQFDSQHRVITHKDFNGRYICAEYDSNGNVTSYAINENSNNLVLNEGFESPSATIQSTWTINSNSGAPSTDESHSGNQSMRIIPNSNTSVYASRTITNGFIADKTYVIGAWVNISGASLDEENKIGVEIKTSSGNTVAFCIMDNTLEQEWQYRATAFKLSQNASSLQLCLTAYNQTGVIYFDDIEFFESNESRADIPNIDTSTSINYTYDANGFISSESLTDGIEAIKREYEYNSFGSLLNDTDINGKKTYYEYDNLTKLVGTQVDQSGNIINGTEFTYDTLSVLQSVTQTVNNVTMETDYGYYSEKIVSVEHNGFEYDFNYNSAGLVTSIECVSGNNTKSYSDYGYVNNRIGYITYSNGYEIQYYYNAAGKITDIAVVKDPGTANEETIKEYIYTYNMNGELVSCEDTATDITVNYLSNGFSLVKDNVTIYTQEIDSNENTIGTYRQTGYTGDNNTSTDVFFISPITESVNSSNGEVTKHSTVEYEKNGYTNIIRDADIDSESTIDYFGRVKEKTVSADYHHYETEERMFSVSSNFNYKQLSTGRTCGLLESVTDSYSTDHYIYSSSGYYYPYSTTETTYFEYYDNNNIKYIYSVVNSDILPKRYYEYDGFNQVITELDFSVSRLYRYAYDSGGNIVSKTCFKMYDENNTIDDFFDFSTRSIIQQGEADSSKAVSYAYDVNFKDRLASYNNTPIQYNDMGSPLNYLGVKPNNTMVSGILEWRGNQLTAYEDEDYRCEYDYDPVGNLVQKKVQDKAQNTYYTLTYVWESGHIAYSIFSAPNSEDTTTNYLYDNEDELMGYISTSGILYLCLTDINGNISGFYGSDGSSYTIQYDAFGNPTYNTYGASIAARLFLNLEFLFNPFTYKGFVYDAVSGLCFSKNGCYSPSWGRFLNVVSPVSLHNSPTSPLDANLYLYKNNNQINSADRFVNVIDNMDISYSARGFAVEMNELFSSRSFCSIFANQLLRENGEFNSETGHTLFGMNDLRIASDLFAHYVAKYASDAICSVNGAWGDGWSMNAIQSDTINIRNNDINAWKYEKIWYAAPEIKEYAWGLNVYLTL